MQNVFLLAIFSWIVFVFISVVTYDPNSSGSVALVFLLAILFVIFVSNVASFSDIKKAIFWKRKGIENLGKNVLVIAIIDNTGFSVLRDKKEVGPIKASVLEPSRVYRYKVIEQAH